MHLLLRSRADTRFGLFTSAGARLAGYASSEIRGLCASGRWVRLRRGVLVTAADLATGEEQGRRFQMDCLAVLLSLDGATALLSHASAARLWGFRCRVRSSRRSGSPIRCSGGGAGTGG